MARRFGSVRLRVPARYSYGQFLPTPASVAHLHRTGLTLLPLKEPAPRTELAVVSRRNDPSPVLENFLAIVRAQVERRERG